MRCNQLLVVLLALAALLIDSSAVAQESPFTETFEVVRSEWYRGEDVLFKRTRCNATGEQLIIPCSSSCWVNANFIISDSSGLEVARREVGCLTIGVCLPESWGSTECRSVVHEWSQVRGRFPEPGDGPAAEAGVYYAETLFDDPSLRTSNFQILAASLPIPMLGGAAMTILLALLMVVGSHVLRSRRV